jgi:CPA2 family monovalent cation:H+ antiporter-2
MIVTPFLTQVGSRLAQKLERHHAAREAEAMNAAAAEPLPPEFPQLENHVIVAGYGDAARQLVRVLNGSRIPYVITTLSPGGAAEAEAEGLPVIRGNASKQLTLMNAGLRTARIVVIADDDPATAHRIAQVARPVAPDARILVRTRYVGDIEPLTQAGASRVIAEELESVLQLFADVLRAYDIPPAEIEDHEATVRRGGYAALRFETMPDEPVVVCNLPDGSCPTPASPKSQETPMPRRIDTQHRIELKSHVPASRCAHLPQTHPVLPSAPGCEECLKMGDSWVHLRICMSCGHVGCCDSSKNKHATKHYHTTTHPIVRSLEPGEDWGWCYEDEVML